VPVVTAFDVLEFRAAVTFFVGDNGSGKSTILETIASGLRATAVGSSDVEHDGTLQAARLLAAEMRFERRNHARTRMFFRAEDIFGFIQRLSRSMDDLAHIEEEFQRTFKTGSTGQRLATGAVRGQRRALESRYGKEPDSYSHGELFLSLLASRLTPKGLYLIDEPEAPLSPRGVLQLIALIMDRVRAGCQFIVATHSPMLLALAGADIYLFENGRISTSTYEELEHVQLVKSFLQNPHQFLKHFEDPE
jgi:predicted ATPase